MLSCDACSADASNSSSVTNRQNNYQFSEIKKIYKKKMIDKIYY